MQMFHGLHKWIKGSRLLRHGLHLQTFNGPAKLSNDIRRHRCDVHGDHIGESLCGFLNDFHVLQKLLFLRVVALNLAELS